MDSSNKNILLISNGYGEDAIGAQILTKLYNNTNEINSNVLPIVGEGRAYNSLPVELIGPKKQLPSGGFAARTSLMNLLKDIKAGLGRLTWYQIKAIRNYSSKTDLILVVGDVYILLLAGLFTDNRIIFLPTAKSKYINGHYRIEKYIIKKYANLVFPRDQKTSKELIKFDINSEFVGNVMMDCIEIKGVDFYLKQNDGIIGLLPGSREEAYTNIIYFLKVIDEIDNMSEKKFEYITAVAGNLGLDNIKQKIKGTNWKLKRPAARAQKSGIKLIAESPSKSSVRFIYHHFGDVIQQADLFLGQAGTANEQAVGLGKPVVSFPGTGSQFTEEFARDQKSLLGQSICLTSRDKKKIAGAVLNIFNNRKLYQEMSREGKKRMGKPGGAKQIAEAINKYFN